MGEGRINAERALAPATGGLTDGLRVLFILYLA